MRDLGLDLKSSTGYQFQGIKSGGFGTVKWCPHSIPCKNVWLIEFPTETLFDTDVSKLVKSKLTVVKQQQREKEGDPFLFDRPISHVEQPQQMYEYALKRIALRSNHSRSRANQDLGEILTVTMKESTRNTKRNQISTCVKMGLYVLNWNGTTADLGLKTVLSMYCLRARVAVPASTSVIDYVFKLFSLLFF